MKISVSLEFTNAHTKSDSEVLVVLMEIRRYREIL